MGWWSKITGKDAANEQRRRNRVQEAENAIRKREIDTANMKMEDKALRFEYGSLLSQRTQDARIKAEQGVTARRSKGIKDSSKLIDDYGAQERRRFMRARKGQGQVRAQDQSITGDMVKGAKSLLNRGADYWENLRSVAGDEAYNQAKAGFLGEYGTEDAYAGKGELATAARQRGRDYQRGGGQPAYRENNTEGLMNRLGNTSNTGGRYKTKKSALSTWGRNY